jgi:hypothetical protein
MCDKNVTSLYIDRVTQMDRHMPKMVKKGDLPSKICAACQKPFAWRKKWAKDWDNVRFCSDRCRRTR